LTRIISKVIQGHIRISKLSGRLFIAVPAQLLNLNSL
jgi:hypothetical protein